MRKTLGKKSAILQLPKEFFFFAVVAVMYIPEIPESWFTQIQIHIFLTLDISSHNFGVICPGFEISLLFSQGLFLQ